MSQAVYPISSLIQRIIRESELSRSQFVQVIGFKNTAKGLRRLDGWLECGRGDQGFLERIVAQYQPDPVELHAALAATEAIHRREHQEAVLEIEERERRRFKPFVWVVTEGGAHSSVMAMAERQVKRIRFHEGFEKLSRSEQLAAVQLRVRDHYQKTDGKLAHFGAILRYKFCDSFDTSTVLDNSGDVIEANSGRFVLLGVWFLLH